VLHIHCVSKKRAPFYFCDHSVCCWPIFRIFGNFASKGNLQRNTHFKVYIDTWYLIVTQAENTPSTATVDINITQQNPTLKLVTQFEMNAKPSKRRSDQVFKMSSTSFHASSSVKNMKSTADSGKRHSAVFVREFGATHSLQQWVFAQVASLSISTRAVRRRTGGRRRRWVVLWPEAAASAASDRMREHWNSALAGQAFFLVLQRSATSPVISAGLLAPKS